MLIYNYDSITKEYLGHSNADLDPEETKQQGRNVYLIPANATTIEPPINKVDYARLFINNAWEYEHDYRANYYMVDSNLDVLDITEIGELSDGYILVTKELGDLIKANPDDYVIDNDTIREKTEEEETTKREQDFNSSFFLTSLGYIRRSVTMADGTHKDFLSDLLPVISMGVQGGQAVNILTYDKPPFDEDVTDWTEYQHQVVVTPQFIQECFMQLSNDFLPINEGVE